MLTFLLLRSSRLLLIIYLNCLHFATNTHMSLGVRSLRLIIITSSSSCRRRNDVLCTKTAQLFEVHVLMYASITAWLRWAWHLNSTAFLSDVLTFEHYDIVISCSTYYITHRLWIFWPSVWYEWYDVLYRERLKYKNYAYPTCIKPRVNA